MRGGGSAGSAIDERPGDGRAARPEHRSTGVEFNTPATMLEDVWPPAERPSFPLWTVDLAPSIHMLSTGARPRIEMTSALCGRPVRLRSRLMAARPISPGIGHFSNAYLSWRNAPTPRLPSRESPEGRPPFQPCGLPVDGSRAISDARPISA